MRLFLLLVLTSSLLFSEMLERTQVLMGTFATITLPTEDARQMQKGFEVLKSVEHALSSYQPHADIYTLNHQREANLSSYTYEALQLSRQYYKETDGYFDITVGSITKGLYHFGATERVPSKRERDEAIVDFRGLHFTSQGAWLEKGVVVDLGGMGKGFGVDKVAVYLHENNITQGEIALSGDIRCLGICKMEIQNPFGEGSMAEFTTNEPNTAVSTSGNYRRYVGNKENNHLIDPKAKHPQQVFASITLLSHGSNSDIDAYATAASVMPLEKAIAFLERMQVGYVLITNGGDQYVSENLGGFVKILRFTKRVPFTCETE